MMFALVVGSMCHGGNNQAASFRFIWACSLMAGGHLEKPNGARAEMWILSISPTCPPVYLVYNLSRNNRLVEPNACIHPTPCIWDQLISLGVLGYLATTLIHAIRLPLQIDCLFTYENCLGSKSDHKNLEFCFINPRGNCSFKKFLYLGTLVTNMQSGCAMLLN